MCLESLVELPFLLICYQKTRKVFVKSVFDSSATNLWIKQLETRFFWPGREKKQYRSHKKKIERSEIRDDTCTYFVFVLRFYALLCISEISGDLPDGKRKYITDSKGNQLHSSSKTRKAGSHWCFHIHSVICGGLPQINYHQPHTDFFCRCLFALTVCIVDTGYASDMFPSLPVSFACCLS